MISLILSLTHWFFSSVLFSLHVFVFFHISLKKNFYEVFHIYACAGFLLLQGLFSSCSKQGLLWLQRVGLLWLLCAGLSCGRAQALGYSGFSGFGSQLQSTGLQVVVLELSCPSACGIFLDQGWNPHLLPWQVDSLPLGQQESPFPFFFLWLISGFRLL